MPSSKYPAVYDISGAADVPVYTGAGGFDKSVAYCKRLKDKSADVLMRVFTLASGSRCLIVMTDGMAAKDNVEQSVILAARRFDESCLENKFDSSDGELQQFGITEWSEEPSLSRGYISALTGDVLCVVEGRSNAYVFGYRNIPGRSVGESPVEGSVQGPHEAFCESVRSNTALLRRRVSDPNMVIEHLKVGRRSHTTVAVCYIRGLTAPRYIAQTLERIKGIDIDIIGDSGELAQLIEDEPNGIFPQTATTELPDAAAEALCGGRVLVMVNGSPGVLMLPATLPGLMHVAEDNYQRWSFASFVKLLRWVALVIALSGSAFYVAVVSYHPGLLPTDLLLISAVNRVSVPFPAVAEVLILEFSLELLREASIRMPRGISGALSIVGGLIIGDAAISAGLISPLLVIIVGLSNLAGFTIPSYSLASSVRLLKYMLILLSALLGMLGLVSGMMIVLSLLSAADSLGEPFTAPFAPAEKRGMLKGLLELPARSRQLRDAWLHPSDRRRMRQHASESAENAES